MIEIQNVSKTFSKTNKAERNSVEALIGTNLVVRENEFLSIIGPSGCGKTTLLKIVDGLIRPDGGRVVIKGQAISGPGPDRAMVFQNFALMPWADVLANVAFPLELLNTPRKQREEAAREKIEAVGLTPFLHHFPHELSGGMQQRVGLARALAANPDILLMDEPFGALDAQMRQLLQEDLLDLWQKERKTVIFVTHSMDEAVYLSDRVVIMKPRPGRVAEILDVPLQRPRGGYEVRRSPQFIELTTYIWETLRSLLREEQAASA